MKWSNSERTLIAHILGPNFFNPKLTQLVNTSSNLQSFVSLFHSSIQLVLTLDWLQGKGRLSLKRDQQTAASFCTFMLVRGIAAFVLSRLLMGNARGASLLLCILDQFIRHSHSLYSHRQGGGDCGCLQGGGGGGF